MPDAVDVPLDEMAAHEAAEPHGPLEVDPVARRRDRRARCARASRARGRSRARSAPRSTTVRQAPLTAMLAPSALSSRTRPAATTSRAPSRSSTRPDFLDEPGEHRVSRPRPRAHVTFDEPVVADGRAVTAVEAERVGQGEAGAADRRRAPRRRPSSVGATKTATRSTRPACDEGGVQLAARLPRAPRSRPGRRAARARSATSTRPSRRTCSASTVTPARLERGQPRRRARRPPTATTARAAAARVRMSRAVERAAGRGCPPPRDTARAATAAASRTSRAGSSASAVPMPTTIGVALAPQPMRLLAAPPAR